METNTAAPALTPEDRVREATRARGWDEEVAESAVRALARRRATAGKLCGRCKELKPYAAFGADSTRHDGKEVRCRRCRRTM